MDQVNGFFSLGRAQVYRWRVMLQTYMDRSVIYVKERWAAEGVLFLIFLARVVLGQGWYVECYALCIFMLNLFLGFLSPRFTPDLQDDIASDDMESGVAGGDQLPSKGKDDEFRPFMRRVPEFHFWQLSFYGTLVALLTTTTRLTDIPVYWPILVIYFFILLFLTMRRQIEHMMKYKYIPFDFGKKRFAK